MRILFKRNHLKIMHRLQCCVILMLLFGYTGAFCSTHVSDSLETKGLRYIQIVPDVQASDMVDSLFFVHALSVVFPVNQSDIVLDDYPELRHFVQDVTPLLHQHSLGKSYLRVRSAASPEGPYLNNKRLAKNRAASLMREFQRYGISARQIKIDVVDEEYELLCFLMKQSNDLSYPLVDSLYTRYASDPVSLKLALQRIDNGLLWKRLLKEYFPTLRASRFMLVMESLDKRDNNLSQLLESAHRPYLADTSSAVQMAESIHPFPNQSAILPKTRRELLSVKTNLLQDVAYVPQYGFCPLWNVAVEYYPLHGHYTFGASFDCPWWQNRRSEHKYFQARNYQLEARRYFRGDGEFRGWYAQGYAHAGLFGVGFNRDKGWQGEAAGLGIGGGYVLPLCKSQHWRLEFQLQAGFVISKYDPYVYGCPVEHVDDGYYYYDYVGDADFFKKRLYRYTWLGPTRVGITLTYDLLYRKRKSK